MVNHEIMLLLGMLQLKFIGKGQYNGSNQIFYPLISGFTPAETDSILNDYKATVEKTSNSIKFSIQEQYLNNIKTWNDIKLPKNWSWAYISSPNHLIN